MFTPPRMVRSVLLQATCLVLLSLSRTTGVTHWKLQDNAVIVPAGRGLSEESDDITAMIPDLQMKDPEFALLLRHVTGTKAGGGKGAVPRQRAPGACPVVVDVDAPQSKAQSTKNGKKQCSSDVQRTSAPRNPDGSGVMYVS